MDEWLEVLRTRMPFIGIAVWILLAIVSKTMSRRARRDQTPSGASPTPRSEEVAQRGASEQEPLSNYRPIVPR